MAGCGCGRSKNPNVIAQVAQTIFQVVDFQGNILSEHDTAAVARSAAAAAQARVRITSRRQM